VTTTLRVCRYCDGLITDEAPGKAVVYEHAASGPGREVWAHNEHAHLVKPDPQLLDLLLRIRLRKAGRS
jgi:hypothetical protein